MMTRGMSGLSRPVLIVLAVVVVLLGATPAVADANRAAAPDTVRTNLWLTEALMADATAAVARILPAAPATILLEAQTASPEDELFGAVVTRQLAAAGYELFVPAADTEEEAPITDLAFSYHVAEIDLTYPEVGRTLGIWRQWVDRELNVSVLVEIVDRETGRVLLNDRITRSYNDRVPGGDFNAVNSGMYEFTDAKTEESGWQRRTEEIVVLGALAGLVAIYFANTSN